MAHKIVVEEKPDRYGNPIFTAMSENAVKSMKLRSACGVIVINENRELAVNKLEEYLNSNKDPDGYVRTCILSKNIPFKDKQI